MSSVGSGEVAKRGLLESAGARGGQLTAGGTSEIAGPTQVCARGNRLANRSSS